MKKGMTFLLVLCMLLSSGFAAMAETLVFSFTITEDPGETEIVVPENGLLEKDPSLTDELTLKVEAENYREALWSNQAPVFTLSLEEAELPEGCSYGFALTKNDKIEIYSLSSNVFESIEEGEYSIQFLVLNAEGRRAAADAMLYRLKLDFTPPSLLVRVMNSAVMNVVAGDQGSGVAQVTVSGAAPVNPSIAADGTYSFSQTASKSITYPDGAIIATDHAGNATANNATVSLYVLNASAAAGAMDGMQAGGMSGSFGGFGGSSGGGSRRTVYHSASKSNAVVAYNAVELSVQEESMTRLHIGDEALDLELYHHPFPASEEPDKQEQGSFSARFGKWNSTSSETDTLLLQADEADPDGSTWVFTGKVYKKLAASGIDYLVFQCGEDVTALSTAGFTAGIRYSMYRAAGLGSGSFEYELSMTDEGFEMNVTVDGQTYPLSQDPASEFYYYDVFNGTMDQLHFSES